MSNPKIPRVFHVYGDAQPTEAKGTDAAIPTGWLIFNAPRPLYASRVGDTYMEWTGNFHHGIFYAAVDPSDQGSIDRNVSLDGWVLRWHTIAEVEAWATDYCDEYGLDRADYDLSEFKHTFFDQLNDQEEEIWRNR